MIGFGLVGCGRIGERHARLLGTGAIPGARLVGVCDIRPERVSRFASEFGSPGFSEIEQMLQVAKPDVVVVCTPSGNHAETTIRIARQGVHVVVEKPMALTLADADEMILACAEAQVRLFVVKQNRFNLPIALTRSFVESGRLGRLTLGTVRVRWCRTDEYYRMDDWRGTWADDGGVLANQASHHIDALTWMMGPVRSVFAKATTSLASIEVEDTALAIVQFESGALGAIEATTAARPRDIEGSLSILGEFGSIEVAGKSLNELRVLEFEDSATIGSVNTADYSENPPDIYGFGHRRYLENVVRSISENAAQLVDGFEGRKSLELISAIYESIETGREVALRFVPRKSKLGHRSAP